jgi:CelD/BcsL family acetyltransferase involved in cellulose biosynthesis
VLGLRETWFQQTGEASLDSIYAEYVDFLCEENVTHDIRRDAVCAILNESGADSFVFCNLYRKMSAAVFSAAAVCGLSGRVLSNKQAYVCELGGDAFMTKLSKSLRTKISRSLRLYEERGPLSARVARTGAEKAAAWEKLRALHKDGWEARGEKSVFENNRLIEFHDRLARIAPEALHLFEVKAGAETIAVLYNFVHGDRVMNYQSGFKFEEDNRLAPGFVAHALAAQNYQDSGFAVYDLLAGEADYKSRLGRAGETLTSLVVERPTWRNKLRAVLKR